MRDCVTQILSFLPDKDLASARLVSREWREIADSLLTDVTSAFLSCRPDCGTEVDALTVRQSGSSIVFTRVNGKTARAADRAAVKAACEILAYKAIRPGIQAFYGKAPTVFRSEYRLSTSDCQRIWRMENTLVELDLTGLGTETMHSRTRSLLCTAISEMKRLTTLLVPSYDIDASNAGLISKCKTLTNLDMFQNDICDEGLEALTALTGLRNLNVANNVIGSAISRLSRLTGLQHLVVNFNGTPDDTLAAAVEPLRELVSLHTRWNNVGFQTIRALSGLSFLRELDLSFTDVDACQGLSGLAQLTDLKINYSGLSDDEVVSGITMLTNLETLSLSNNNLTDVGATNIAHGLHKSLTYLDLSWNSVGYTGALHIARCMAGLKHLDLRKNDVLDVGAAALFELPSITYLNVSHNHLSRTTTQHLKYEGFKRGITVFASYR